MTEKVLWRPNPRREKVEDVVANLIERGYDQMTIYRYVSMTYCYGVPSPRILHTILAYDPLLELGAGTGYWAMRLRRLGADIVAYDPQRFEPKLFPVKRGDHRVAERYPERTLMLVWPTKRESWAAQAVERYQGTHVIYIGDRRYQQTANSYLGDVLRRSFRKCVEEVVGSWPQNFMDWLQIWERKTTRKRWWRPNR